MPSTDDDPRSYKRALEHELSRPKPAPFVRHTGRPIMVQLIEALGLDKAEPEVPHAKH